MNSLEMLRQGRQAFTPPLTVLGNMPQDPVDFVRTSYPRRREVLDALARRLVDHVAVQLEGKTVCTTSVPMLHHLPLGCTT
ncbi:MAG: hypothetical protein ACKPKO_47805, partial [Candidatus Fonsibacter sp.]